MVAVVAAICIMTCSRSLESKLKYKLLQLLQLLQPLTNTYNHGWPAKAGQRE
jgi:hypothetical protein